MIAAAANIAEPNVLFGSSSLVQESATLTRNWTQDINVTGHRSIVAFSVSIPYLACAVVCSLLAVIATVPLYWNARSQTFAPRYVSSPSQRVTYPICKWSNRRAVDLSANPPSKYNLPPSNSLSLPPPTPPPIPQRLLRKRPRRQMSLRLIRLFC
jgi:hypothetical protein